jgi:hypothetical protein
MVILDFFDIAGPLFLGAGLALLLCTYASWKVRSGHKATYRYLWAAVPTLFIGFILLFLKR